MDHSYFRDKVSAYFDNELSPQEKEIIEQHIAQCQECQDLLAEFKRLDQVIEKHSQLAGEEYWEQSAQKIEHRLGFTREDKVTDITPSRWKGLVPKLAAVAASVAILGFIALYEKEISKEVGLYAPKATAPSPIILYEDTVKLFREQVLEERLAEVPVVDASEAVKKRELVTKRARKAIVPSPPAAVIGTVRDEPEGIRRTADEAKVLQVQKEAVTTVDELLPKVAGSTTDSSKGAPARGGQAGEVASESVQQKSDSLPETIESMEVGRGEGFVISEVTVSPADFQVAKERPEDAEIPIDTTAASEDTVSTVVSALVLPDDWVQPADLEQWRHRRDSLQTLYANMTSPHLFLSQAKSRQKASLASGERVQGLLLFTNYQVARLTEDETEREAAISFLNVYSQKPESPYKDLARKLLEELGQHGE